MRPRHERRWLALGGVFVVVFGVLELGMHATAEPERSELNKRAENTPLNLLRACAHSARGMDPVERTFLLVRVADIAANHQYRDSAAWAREAFVAAVALPKDWNRTSLQKNALRALSSTHPMEALRLLGTVQAPDFDGNLRIPEDVRADASRQIFDAAYKASGKRSLPLIEEVSTFLGQTGEYPYSAWAELLPRLAAEDSDSFREAVRTAVYYYSRATDRIRTQDSDYFEMVNRIQALADRAQMKAAVDAALDHLEAEKPQENETVVIVASSAAGRATFDDRTKAMFYQWLPLVEHFDSDRYEALANTLKVYGTPTPSEPLANEIIGNKSYITQAVRQVAADRLQAGIVMDDAAKDPEAALRESVAIVSLTIRSDALALAANTVPPGKESWRGKFLAASRSSLDHAENKDQLYLHALADLTDGYYHLGLKSEAMDGVQSGLSLGVEVVNESADGHPNTPTMLLSGYDDLAQLTKIGLDLDSKLTLRTVRNLEDSPLKSNLMADIADALASGLYRSS